MKLTRLILVALCLLLCSFAGAPAQELLLAKAAKELVDAIVSKGGQQAAKELAEIGGEAFAREALEQAAKEGGASLARKLAAQTIEYGPAFLKVAKSSPSKFLAAFDELSPVLQKGAAQAINREPDLMASLFSKFGKDALTAAAAHPGVGTRVVESLGRPGAELLSKVSEDEAIQLSRLSSQLAKSPEAQRPTLMDAISEAPRKVLDFLENHPNVMLTAAGVTSFIAAKKELLGGAEVIVDKNGVVTVVAKPGFFERISQQFTNTFHAPLAGIILIVGLVILAWAAIKLWSVFRVEKAKVQIAESRLANKADQESAESKPKSARE